MHLTVWYLDFRILGPPLFEQEFVQIRQGQKEPIREAGNHMMRSQLHISIFRCFLQRLDAPNLKYVLSCRTTIEDSKLPDLLIMERKLASKQSQNDSLSRGISRSNFQTLGIYHFHRESSDRSLTPGSK